MKKLASLLNESTIVDLKVFFQIVSRYKAYLAYAFIFFCLFFAYQFFNQPVIYSINAPIKLVTKHRVSSDALSLLPVDNADTLTLNELTIMLSSVTFLNSLSENLIKDQHFSDLDFGSTESRKSLTGLELKKLCHQDSKCIVNGLNSLLKKLFYIEQGLTENRFQLIVSAIDKKTTRSLLSHLLKTIELERIRVRQYAVLKEMSSVKSLIEESRSLMESMKVYTALEEQEKLDNDIIDLKDRIRMLQSNLSIEMANNTLLAAKVAENKRTTTKETITKENYEAFVKTQSRLDEVKQNISNLTHIPSSDRSATDKIIISQLINERNQLAAKLPAGKKISSIVQDEQFKDKQRENSGNYEFDYLVSKNKIVKLNTDYEDSKVELNEMLQLKISNDNKINGMKSDLDFLKSLEAKLMSLKLLNVTMNSDLIFEESSQNVQEFRKSTVLKVLLFSFAITAFLYLISILIKFASDDRIYNEDEIRMHLSNLNFVGEVPAFN